MYHCDDYRYKFNCLSNDYDRLDLICQAELVTPIPVDDIMIKSEFCTSVAIDRIDKHADDFLSVNEHLSGLKRKIGVYALWIQLGYCQDHKKYKMLCVYVGKGRALERVKEHITEKWNETEELYITFYECENRIAKYLEQLFLDVYDFHLNKDENTGTGYLYADWNEERVEMGTETYAMVEKLVSKFPDEFE